MHIGKKRWSLAGRLRRLASTKGVASINAAIAIPRDLRMGFSPIDSRRLVIRNQVLDKHDRSLSGLICQRLDLADNDPILHGLESEMDSKVATAVVCAASSVIMRVEAAMIMMVVTTMAVISVVVVVARRSIVISMNTRIVVTRSVTTAITLGLCRRCCKTNNTDYQNCEVKIAS